MIPRYLRPLFWDTNVENLDPTEFPTYTIGRVLEFGDRDGIAWLKNIFTEAQIVSVIRTERRLSRRSATFWALIYDVPYDQVAALRLAS